VEFKTAMCRIPEVLRRIDEVSRQLETIVAVGVSTRCDENGDSALDNVLRDGGFHAIRGKTNLGLGRATVTAS